ncbi:MAG: amidohydrolase family protein, partial [Gemmatimonadaceae bacterium]
CDASMTELGARIALLSSRATSLVRLGLSPHAPYTVSDDLYRAVARFAAEQTLPIAVHIAESREETAFVTEGDGPFADGWRSRGIGVAPRASSSIALLETTGVLGARPLLIHCVHVTPADIAKIADARCPVAHCPASNAKLGHGVAPLTSLIAAGVPVGLGSDSVASSNQMDLVAEARLAVLLARVHPHGIELDANHALSLATIGGARALGMDAETGSLEVGKSADLAAFRAEATRDEPVYDPAAALVFGATGRRAPLVCVAGRELVRDGRLLVSLEGDLSAVKAAAERLAGFQPTSESRG